MKYDAVPIQTEHLVTQIIGAAIEVKAATRIDAASEARIISYLRTTASASGCSSTSTAARERTVSSGLSC